MASSIAQTNKLTALVMDGTVMWAPKVRGEIGKTGDFTGSGPHGFEMDVIRRLNSGDRHRIQAVAGILSDAHQGNNSVPVPRILPLSNYFSGVEIVARIHGVKQ